MVKLIVKWVCCGQKCDILYLQRANLYGGEIAQVLPLNRSNNISTTIRTLYNNIIVHLQLYSVQCRYINNSAVPALALREQGYITDVTN